MVSLTSIHSALEPEKEILEHIEKLWKYTGAVLSLGGTFSVKGSLQRKFSPTILLKDIFRAMNIFPPGDVHIETLAYRDSSYISFAEILWYFKHLRGLTRSHHKSTVVICGTDQLANIANVADIFQTKSVLVGSMDPFGRDRLVNFWLAMQAAEELYRSRKNDALLAQGGCIAEPPFLTKEDPQALFGSFGSRLTHPAFSLQPNGELIKHRKPWSIHWNGIYEPNFDEIFDNTMAYGHVTLGKILTVTARLDIYQAERLLALVESAAESSNSFLGIIIRGFGTGGIQTRMPLRKRSSPTENHSSPTILWRMLKKITQDIPVVMTTQCARGGVTEDYEYAETLKEAGILLSGYFTEDFLDVYMTTLAVASLTQTLDEKNRGPWMKKQLEKFFQNNTFPA